MFYWLTNQLVKNGWLPNRLVTTFCIKLFLLMDGNQYFLLLVISLG